jgi:AcrR family transcriptional regulator
MTDQRRRYRMNARAEQQDRTRQRITESAAELHGTLGPSRTSMSAVAEHAGVRRSTLYRHFPDEASLFAACSGHWVSRHPLPDLTGWARLPDRDERLRVALSELYAYYEGAEPMLSNLVRDLDLVEAVRVQFAMFLDYQQAAHDVLMAGRRGRGRRSRRASAVIGHAIAFTTWRSLVREQGCSLDEAVELMARLAE